MTAVLALGVGALFAVGTYLLLQRTLTRIVLGLGLLGHGTNLLLLTIGGGAGAPPVIGTGTPALDGPGAMADPMPQALALTAIVISFGVTAFLLALAWRSWSTGGHDDVEHAFAERRDALATAEGEVAA